MIFHPFWIFTVKFLYLSESIDWDLLLCFNWLFGWLYTWSIKFFGTVLRLLFFSNFVWSLYQRDFQWEWFDYFHCRCLSRSIIAYNWFNTDVSFPFITLVHNLWSRDNSLPNTLLDWDTSCKDTDRFNPDIFDISYPRIHR